MVLLPVQPGFGYSGKQELPPKGLPMSQSDQAHAGPGPMVAAAGAAALSAALLADAVGAERNPAAKVEDRASSIRIKSLRAMWVNPVVFLRIETNHGIVGWGDIKGVDPRVAKPLAESLFPLLDGENPTRIEYL